MLDEIFGAIIEGVVALFSAIVEGLSVAFEWIATGFSAMVHAIADLFMGDTAGVGVGVLLGVFLLLLVELVLWLCYLVFELVMMLIQRRRPQKVKKPVIWRPQQKSDET